jgi:hypothetical protein
VIPVSDICEFLQDKLAPAPDFKQLIQKDPLSNPDTDFDMLSNISEEALSAYGDLSSDELENLIKAAYNLYEFYKANPNKLKQGSGSLIQTCLAQGFTILHGRATHAENTGVAAGENLGLIAGIGNFLGELGQGVIEAFANEENQSGGLRSLLLNNPQPVILSQNISGITATEIPSSLDGVPLPEILTAIEKHGDNEKLANPVEIFDINPAAKLENTNRCIVFLYDPSVKSTITDDENTDYSIDRKGGIISIGHYYVGLAKVENGHCIKSKLYGKNPATEGTPVSKAEISKENQRYKNAKNYKNQHNISVLKEVGILVTEEKYQAVSNYIQKQEKEPGMYVGHFNDCITFSDQILKIAGLEHVKATDILRPVELSHITLARISAWLRSLDNKVVYGISANEVAKDYGISVERLERMLSPMHDVMTFRILPYDRYLQKIKEVK